jgi:hypothetical protein
MGRAMQVLDTARVKAAAESALKETGEVVPGIEVTMTEYVSITRVDYAGEQVRWRQAKKTSGRSYVSPSTPKS